MGGHRPHGIDDRLPDLVFTGTELAGAAEMEPGAMLVLDRQVHRKQNQLRGLGVERSLFIFDVEKFLVGRNRITSIVGIINSFRRRRVRREIRKDQ